MNETTKRTAAELGIKVVGRGTGWVDFEVGGLRATVFSDGTIGFPSHRIPAEVKTAARFLRRTVLVTGVQS